MGTPPPGMEQREGVSSPEGHPLSPVNSMPSTSSRAGKDTFCLVGKRQAGPSMFCVPGAACGASAPRVWLDPAGGPAPGDRDHDATPGVVWTLERANRKASHSGGPASSCRSEGQDPVPLSSRPGIQLLCLPWGDRPHHLGRGLDLACIAPLGSYKSLMSGRGAGGGVVPGRVCSQSAGRGSPGAWVPALGLGPTESPEGPHSASRQGEHLGCTCWAASGLSALWLGPSCPRPCRKLAPSPLLHLQKPESKPSRG